MNESRRDSAALEALLLERLRERLGPEGGEIELDTPFDRLGLDSAQAVMLSLEIESELGQQIDPVAFFDYPSIRELSAFLSEM